MSCNPGLVFQTVLTCTFSILHEASCQHSPRGLLPGVPFLDLEQVPPSVNITRGQCEPRTICVPDACPLPMRRSVAWCVLLSSFSGLFHMFRE